MQFSSFQVAPTNKSWHMHAVNSLVVQIGVTGTKGLVPEVCLHQDRLNSTGFVLLISSSWQLGIFWYHYSSFAVNRQGQFTGKHFVLPSSLCVTLDRVNCPHTRRLCIRRGAWMHFYWYFYSNTMKNDFSLEGQELTQAQYTFFYFGINNFYVAALY